MKHSALVGFFSAIFGVLIVLAIFHFSPALKEAGSAPQVNLKVEPSPPIRDSKLGTSFAPVVQKVAPSVVNIYSTTFERDRSMPVDPLFRQFFGAPSDNNDNPRRMHRDESLGSGVIISPDGYILTADHMVEGAEEVKVSIGKGKKEFDAKVVGTDPPTDVAVLKIDAKDLSAITLGDSDQLEVGDVVLAIGNPFGIGQTVTMGIVSATGRGGLGINAYEDFIQTDAAINMGNSGGALVDAEGRLIGINTAIMSGSGGNQGIGFAVPVDLARNVMERLISGGKVTRGYLGVFPQDITPGLAEEFKLPDENGALVGNVMPNTPAEKAGIKVGDVIIEFNGKQISDANGLRLLVSELVPGTKAGVKLLRSGGEKNVTITLAELPQNPAQNENNENGSDNENQPTADALDGVTVTDLNRHVRRELDLPVDIQGALVTDVDSDSNAADAGLQRGDIIIQINRQTVHGADDAVDFCRKAKGDQILLQVWRRDGDIAGTRYISVDNTKQK
jgi:serine protease Do